jgi:multidrug efflux pump subunit AcrB
VISRFFVDRPIFATVISIVIVLAGLVAVGTLPVAQYPEVTPPTVQVTALYPGANAQTVRDTVAAPIEEQVSGVEGMVYMSSRCTNDGAYNLTVTFKLGMDSDLAQILVQNRVALALPVIPGLVQNEGISVKKMSPNTLMIVNLVSPNGSFDELGLSNYATRFVKDDLLRLPGIAGITYLGQRDYSMRAWLDPDKLAALNLGAMDVVAAVAQQNVQVAAGQIGQQPVPKGQQFQLTINTQGRLQTEEQFREIIVKAAQGSSQGQGSMNGSSAQAAPSAQGSMNSQGGTDNSGGPTPQSTGIVRLRQVTRADKYFVRLKLDPARLAAKNLRAREVTAALKASGITIREDPDAQPVDGETLTWLAVYGGDRAPFADEVAQTRVIFGQELAAAQLPARGQRGSVRVLLPQGPANAGDVYRLGDLVVPESGIEHLEKLDEKGVELGAQQYDQSATLDGRPTVAVSIYALPGANALDTAARVYAKMKDLKTRFPDGLDYEIVYDTTPFIHESVMDVVWTLFEALILVAVVVLVFLQDWRAMILPMIDVPVSLIGTFAVMALMGFTLNNLTLFGLVLAIGIVVDDAIVVLENIERQIATGLDARSATIKAMEEITGPVLAITLVLSSVFVPCCFLGGVSGQFFRQFAVTISVSTIISAINALTMTPSRAVLIFKGDKAKGHGRKREALPWWIFAVVGGVATAIWRPKYLAASLDPAAFGLANLALPDWAITTLVYGVWALPGVLFGAVVGWFVIRPVNAVLGWFFRGFNRWFDRMTTVYGRSVGQMLRVSVVVCMIYGGLLLLTYWQFKRTPTGFIPQQDKGYLLLNVQLPDSASVERTQRVMQRIELVALGARRMKKRTGREFTREEEKKYPGVAGIDHTLGISGQSLILSANAPNLGSMYVILDEFDRRRGRGLNGDAIAAELQKRCREEVRGALVSVFGAPPIDGLGTTGGFRLIVEDRGGLGLTELERVSNTIVDRGSKSSELKGLFNSSGANTPWLYLEIDRTKCLALGVQVSDIFNTLQVYLGSYYVNNFNDFGRTWQVNLQADPKFRSNVTDIGQLQVRSNQGQMIRLSTVLDVRDTGGPVAVLRYNMYSAAAITGDGAAGVSSGEAVALMHDLAAQELPRSMAVEWTDLAFLQLQAGNQAMWFFLLAVVFVFLVLAAQYESWKLPLAVILVVPMCLLCSVVGLFFARMEVNIFTQIGFVVLVGLASKNAILIVEFAKQQQEVGVPLRQATVEACRLRLRPILMTSFAFILGVVPLVIAQGAGAEMRRSLGLAVFGGMLGVTLFGVFLTPVFFYVIQRFGVAQHRSEPPQPLTLLRAEDTPASQAPADVHVREERRPL